MIYCNLVKVSEDSTREACIGLWEFCNFYGGKRKQGGCLLFVDGWLAFSAVEIKYDQW